MTTPDPEAAVRSCYSTWGETYFADYYGDGAAYPPVHVELVRRLLAEAGARRVLDAGCGPASMLRVLPPELDRYGFDLTPEMITVAKRVLGEQGVPEEHLWIGSVTDPGAFRLAADGRPYDAAICVGVLPHIPADGDEVVIDHLVGAVRPGGLVVVEARNQLFSLFTLNRYTRQLLLDELIPVDRLHEVAGDDVGLLDEGLTELEGMLRVDLPPVRTGDQEPGYDEVLSRTHNPLVLRDQLAARGLDDVRILFYHWHALPPLVGARVPDLQHKVSLELERPDDWRGLVMASAFLVVGTAAP